MFTKKKMISLLLITVFLIGLITGCGTGSGNASESTRQSSQTDQTSDSGQKPQELVTLSALVWDRGMMSDEMTSFDDNWWTKYVDEHVAKFGIKVKYIAIPRSAEEVKLPTMIAGGEAPDVCYTYDRFLLNTLAKNKALIDYTDYIGQYGTNITKLLDQETMEAGKIFGRQYTIMSAYNAFANTTWIRKDWLEKLGLETPKRLDEMYNALKLFKEKDPGNVGKDLAPLLANSSFVLWDRIILPAFVKDPPTKEKLLTPVALWPETRDCLKFLNKLYNEKLLEIPVLDKDSSQFKEKIISGKAGSFLMFEHYPYHPAYGGLLEKLQQNIPDATLYSIYPWQGESEENFIEFMPNNPKFQFQYFSPITCKYPEKVVQYLDWLATKEAYFPACYGLEGIDYNLVNGMPKIIDQAKFDKRVPFVTDQYNALCDAYLNDSGSFLSTYAEKNVPEKFREDFIKTAVTDYKYFKPLLSSATPVSDKLGPALDDLWKNAVIQMIMAPASDFDALFDSTLKAYKDQGGEKVAEEAISLYRQETGK